MKVTIYTKEGCPPCTSLKQALRFRLNDEDFKNVKFISKENGVIPDTVKAFPTTIFNETGLTVVGFSSTILDKILKEVLN